MPFAVKLERPEVIEKLIKESNHFEDHDPNSKLFEIYNKNQALQRQWIKESREFHYLKNTMGEQMPYQTLGGFRRASRAKSDGYLRIHRDIMELGAAKKTQKYLIIMQRKGIIKKKLSS